MLDPLGVKYVLTDGGPEQDVFYQRGKSAKENGDKIYFKEWGPKVIQVVKNLKPDIVVCDGWSRCGGYAADEMDIPCVIQSPGPISLLS